MARQLVSYSNRLLLNQSHLRAIQVDCSSIDPISQLMPFYVASMDGY